MTVRVVLLVLAIVCFVLAAFRFPTGGRAALDVRLDWMNLGFAFVVASWIAV